MTHDTLMTHLENPAFAYATDPARTEQGAERILRELLRWTEEARQVCLQLTPKYRNCAAKFERLDLIRLDLDRARHHAERL